jgi:hypothetical protein
MQFGFDPPISGPAPVPAVIRRLRGQPMARA